MPATLLKPSRANYEPQKQHGMDLDTDYASPLRKASPANRVAAMLPIPWAPLLTSARANPSPWVGVSEQRSRNSRSEETRSILLLDEADSFFTSREPPRNWAHPGQRVLTRMEEFGRPSLRQPSPPTLTRRSCAASRGRRILHPERRSITELLDATSRSCLSPTAKSGPST